MLLDRAEEIRTIDAALDRARAGSSSVLVLRGDAGIGKTLLLEHVAGQAEDFRVVRVVGVESELDLGFAGLHQLLLAFLSRVERLPPPQAQALRAAFGITPDRAPDRFLVALAALTLLSASASEGPLLVVVDDAQWLDEESVAILAFVARRLYADPIAFLFAVREPQQRPVPLDGFPELRLSGLPENDARELIASVATERVDQRTADRIIVESDGNPLALLELTAELGRDQLAGEYVLDPPLQAPRPEEQYRRRILALPASTQSLLLLAAAERDGDPAVIWRACDRLGLDRRAADAAEDAGLIVWAPRVAFRHPLIRSAVHRAASRGARTRVHEALATDTDVGVDLRPAYLAAATLGPDERVAAELEAAADRARSRGGWAGGASFLERAAALTPDDHQRASRELAAAQAHLVAGNATRARALIEQAVRGLVEDRFAHAQARRLEGEIRFVTGQLADASALLLQAARALAEFDRRLARDTLLEALEAASFAGRFATSAGVSEVVRTARHLVPEPASPVTAADLLLDGFCARVEGRHTEAAAWFRRAIAALRASDDLRWFGLGCFAASELLDDEARRALARRWVKLARDQGALGVLPLALTFLGETEVRAGRFDAADAIHAEGRDISAATGNPGMTGQASPPDLLVLASRGREAEARSVAAAVRQDQTERNVGVGLSYVDAVLTGLELGLANYGAALNLASSVFQEDPFYHGTRILPDLVEAATRCDDQEAAQGALDRLSERAPASGAPWALGLLARSRALIAETALADGAYREAIDELGRSDAAPDLARTHLLYGEWLRRQRRRRDARAQLVLASDLFNEMGAGAFAERARTELLATGGQARKRIPEARDELTPQETQIARLAAAGATTNEIAAQLFISASTVNYHLKSVYRKLGINSRRRLPPILDELAGQRRGG